MRRRPHGVLHEELAEILRVPAVLAAGSTALAAGLGEWAVALGFAVAAVAAWWCSRWAGRTAAWGSDPDLARHGDRGTAHRTVVLGWVLVSLIGGIPFLVAAWASPSGPVWVETFRQPAAAAFEGISGFTSTGLTMCLQASELPHGLQWWRSLMEWVGGLGIVLFVIALSSDADEDEDTEPMHEAEFGELFRTRAAAASRNVLSAYIPLTLGTVVLFGLAGMPWWEALNHGMTAISTGGFAVTDDSFAGYDETIRRLAMVPMVVGAVSFGVLLRVGRRDFVRLLRDHALHLYLVFGLVVAGLVFLAGGGFGEVALFDAVSAVTTTGFSAEPQTDKVVAVLVLLAAAMAVGGMRGSTAGGVKIDRVLRIGHIVFRQIPSISGHAPDGEGRAADRSVDTGPGRMASWWAAYLVAGTAVLVWCGAADTAQDPVRAWALAGFEAASALGTSGLSVGIASPDLHWAGKLALCALMWVGRLELMPRVLVQLGAVAARTRRA